MKKVLLWTLPDGLPKGKNRQMEEVGAAIWSAKKIVCLVRALPYATEHFWKGHHGTVGIHLFSSASQIGIYFIYCAHE